MKKAMILLVTVLAIVMGAWCPAGWTEEKEIDKECPGSVKEYDVKVHTKIRFNIEDEKDEKDYFFINEGWVDAFRNIRVPVQVSHIRDLSGMRLRLRGLPEDVVIIEYGWTDFDAPGIFVRTSEAEFKDFAALEQMKVAGWEMRAELKVEMYDFDASMPGLAIINWDTNNAIESSLYTISKGKGALSLGEFERSNYLNGLEEFFKRYLSGIDKVSFAKKGASRYIYCFDKPVEEFFEDVIKDAGQKGANAIYFSVSDLGDLAESIVPTIPSSGRRP